MANRGGQMFFLTCLSAFCVCVVFDFFWNGSL